MAKSHDHEQEERFQVKAAWLYHIEGLTQEAVAKQLNVTRLRVNSALREASHNGIVRVQIHSVHSPCLALEKQFKARYNLDDAFIVPTPADDANAQAIVGAALGRYLSTLLAREDIKVFGMAWGTALNHATRSIIPIPRDDLEIVSVMGGLPKGSDTNGFEITTKLSDLFKARRTFFTAPLYAGSEQSRDTIMIQDVFQEILQKIRSADATATGVGNVSNESIMIREGLPKDITRESLVSAGAVGDLMGYYFNESGDLIDHPINRRIIGINPFELKSMPNVILAAGGQHKVPIISAVLKTQAFNIFVSDQRTAESVLDHSHSK
jgi:DNA-binding transcriptional regulator LsrR (DeoR family)